MSDALTPSSDFFSDVRSILADARRAAYTAVNSAMVAAYWQIGRRIVEEEQGGGAKAKYGDRLLPELSRTLTAEFGKGFSYANLRNFRQFYLTYPNPEICYTLCSKLTWSHNRLIMREEGLETREFYLRQSALENWSVRQLQRQIETRSYQRLLSTQAPESPPEASVSRPSIRDFIKDPYVLEFLGLPEDPAASETEFESAIISRLQSFLLEMGHGFSFVARQMRVSTETSHFYLDLVFYHYILKCFVIIDLKTTKLTHQVIGQIDIYPVRYSHERFPLRLRFAISQGQKFLRRIHERSPEAKRRTRPRKRPLDCFSSSLGTGVLRGLQKPARCHQTGKVSQDGMGETLPQKPNRQLSHGVNVRMFDDLKRGPDDNPTIGLILCTDKDETIVQYSVLKGSEQLFASKYRTVLPTEAELIAELERERRIIEQQQIGGDT